MPPYSMGLLYFITNYAITHYKYLKIDKKIRRGAPSGVLGCQRPGSTPSPATLTQKIIHMDGLFVLIENLHLALYNLH